jgi:hypothetical protein
MGQPLTITDGHVQHCGIPKRIIQTGRQIQPLRNRAAIATVKLFNPDHEYLFFDDEKVNVFVRNEYPQYQTVFDSFRFRIQRYDFFRYLAVYHYGGFYLDLDVLLAAGLSRLLSHKCVFPFEGLTLSSFLRNHYGMDWEIGNYAFGATPGHPFLAAVIDNCVKAHSDPKWVKAMMRGSPFLLKEEYFILNSTGPGLLSRTLAENPALAKTVTVLLSEDVCDRRSWYRFGDFGIHLMDGSWRRPSGSIRRRVGQHWAGWKMQQLLKRSRALGKTRAHDPAMQFTATGEQAVENNDRITSELSLQSYAPEHNCA